MPLLGKHGTPNEPLRLRKAIQHARVGEYRRAMRALQHTGLLSPHDSDALQDLKELHPAPQEPVKRLTTDSLPEAYTASKDIVREVLKGMSYSTSPGPDGITCGRPIAPSR